MQALYQFNAPIQHTVQIVVDTIGNDITFDDPVHGSRDRWTKAQQVRNIQQQTLFNVSRT